MNTQKLIENTPTGPADLLKAGPIPADSPPAAPPVTPRPPATRNGKVARLPKSVRDQLNTMMQDGVPYLTIIDRLGTYGVGLTENNLSNWKSGGYLDWLQ